MAWLHSAGSQQIIPGLGTSNRQGSHKDTKIGNQEYQKENQKIIRHTQYQYISAPTNHNRERKSPLCLPYNPESKKSNNT